MRQERVRRHTRGMSQQSPPAVTALRQEIGRRIKTGESLNSIAQGAGVAQPILYRWYTGERPDISLSNAEKLIQFLELRLAKRPGLLEAASELAAELFQETPPTVRKLRKTT